MGDSPEVLQAKSLGKPEKSFGLSFDKLWGLAKDYKELLSSSIAVLSAILAGITWVNAHFATEEEVSGLECRMLANLNLQLLPHELNLMSVRIDVKQADINRLRQAGNTTEPIVNVLVQFENQVKEMTAEREMIKKSYDDTLKKAVDSSCYKKTK